ncbi:iron ABC transporter substrate-binding protein [Phreatobacter sp.]|uniref:iron ABC transporter substrate-binding protein n=1 Tax=Phreatobacter sp. TaxID=1966341 RepID=UPI0025DC976C|nr:iron ABC transporter substrate-binding protein [Phreatobacter sp.]
MPPRVSWKVDRRIVLGGLGASLAAPALGRTPFVIDGAGRQVPIPARVGRVFPAGPPAAIMLYTLAPDLLIGWPRANRPDEREFLLPDIGSRPEVGRITGRGNTANLELVLALSPDLILDVGSTRRTFAELADRVQGQTGIPYALLDGRFDATAGSFITLGQLTGREDRARRLAAWCDETMKTLLTRIETVPSERRPRVYYARGPRGLETGLAGSINVETVEFLGAVNVARDGVGGGLAQVSLEQVLAWNPEVIITIDQTFAANVRSDPAWRGVRAVVDGRVHLSPKLPFGWVDFPPSVNRMAGLWWLAKILYPALVPEDIRSLTRDFYTLFYHVTPSDAQIDRVLAGRD